MSLLVAASWQGPRYSVVAHTISGHVCGHCAAWSVPGGGPDVVRRCHDGLRLAFGVVGAAHRRLEGSDGFILLALSIVGLGDLLSPAERLACRMADPGCTATQQLSNTGGQLDNAISSLGLLLLVIAAFFLAAAMRGTHGWGVGVPDALDGSPDHRLRGGQRADPGCGLHRPVRAPGRYRARRARDRDPPTDPRRVLTASRSQ